MEQENLWGNGFRQMNTKDALPWNKNREKQPQVEEM